MRRKVAAGDVDAAAHRGDQGRAPGLLLGPLILAGHGNQAATWPVLVLGQRDLKRIKLPGGEGLLGCPALVALADFDAVVAAVHRDRLAHRRLAVLVTVDGDERLVFGIDLQRRQRLAQLTQSQLDLGLVRGCGALQIGFVGLDGADGVLPAIVGARGVKQQVRALGQVERFFKRLGRLPEATVYIVSLAALVALACQIHHLVCRGKSWAGQYPQEPG